MTVFEIRAPSCNALTSILIQLAIFILFTRIKTFVAISRVFPFDGRALIYYLLSSFCFRYVVREWEFRVLPCHGVSVSCGELNCIPQEECYSELASSRNSVLLKHKTRFLDIVKYRVMNRAN